ncbi:MAG: NUDIX hydrolase [Aeromicrobium sp.]|uniref:NUDIX domain-containing protein n=1 Tax=Aeromicrobium sp. TaxID=1871063 RepID=UPI0039E64DC3
MSAAHPGGLPGRLAPDGLGDREAAWTTVRTETVYDSAYLSLRLDTIADPGLAGGEEHVRAVVQPRGAVGVLALDGEDRVLLVEQYRHAAGRRMIELPAGICDVAGEGAQATAARELAEEADLRADDWSDLLVVRTSPGYSTETFTIFRATGLHALPEPERTVREAEEAGLEQWWLPFDEAVAAVLDGRIGNALAAAAILAEHARRSRA